MANMHGKGLEKWNPGQPGFVTYKYFLGLRPHAVAEGYKDGERITGDEVIIKWGPAGRSFGAATTPFNGDGQELGREESRNGA